MALPDNGDDGDEENGRFLYYPVVGSEWRQIVSGTEVEITDIHVTLGLVDVKYIDKETKKLRQETVNVEEFLEWFERT